MVVTLVVSILGAYAIARLQFFGRRQVNFLFLAVYLFPAILLAIPLFVFFTRIGLRGSLFGLVLVYTSQIVPVTIHMLRNYFETVPESLEEAAALDGASRLTIIRKVVAAPGHAGDHGHQPVRVHDRLERVPVRAAVPGREPRELDGVAGPVPARRVDRGRQDHPDGRLGDPHPPDHHRCSSPPNGSWSRA